MMSNRTLIATTTIIGQAEVLLFTPNDELNGTYLVVTVGSHSETETTYCNLKDALNGYNQACLRAETLAGFHG